MIPLALGLGLLATGGSLAGSWLSKKSADKQMKFQDRMSSTAAQRSVQDYRAAGLNPALAYGHTASTPGGASATFQDPVSPGISGAKDVALAKNSMALANREQDNRDRLAAGNLQLMNAQFDKARQEAAVAEQSKIRGIMDNTVMRTVLPNEIQRRVAEAAIALHNRDFAKADAELRALSLPGARNEAALQSWMGTWGAALPFISSAAGPAAGILRALGGLKGKPPLPAKAPINIHNYVKPPR